MNTTVMPDLKTARKMLEDAKREAHETIRILTAEQALKAQRVVWEAGRRKR